MPRKIVENPACESKPEEIRLVRLQSWAQLLGIIGNGCDEMDFTAYLRDKDTRKLSPIFLQVLMEFKEGGKEYDLPRSSFYVDFKPDWEREIIHNEGEQREIDAVALERHDEEDTEHFWFDEDGGNELFSDYEIFVELGRIKKE